MMLKRIALLVQVIFYFGAGLNHFRVPNTYFGLIPPYLPWHTGINILAGVLEIILAAGLIFQTTRERSAYGIIILLLLFIPAHVYFIQVNSCIPGVLCVPQWAGWLRLIIIHPLLIAWAWWNRR